MEKAAPLTLIKGLVGSHAYGYATESSDKDYMSVYIAPVTHYFGLDRFETKASVTESEDNTDYEFLKFVKLCVNFNPNVIPLLYTDLEVTYDDYYCYKYLLENRALFVTNRAYNTLVGYAISQKEKAAKNITGKLGEKRKTLIEKYGYDVKAAAHTIRLMKTAIHLFKYNEVRLDISAEECAEFRSGKFSVEDFNNRFYVLKDKVQSVFLESKLPNEPDLDKINNMCVKILGSVHYDKYEQL